MTNNKTIVISLSIIGLLLVSVAISFAYFSANITNNESESTVVATAAYLELTFIDGSPEINASNILPGWSASKTFSVQNTGDSTAYYVLKITDINNPFVYGGISYKIESNDGGANVDLDTLPLADMPVTGPIEIPVNTTHNYIITTYYNELEESQMQDLGKTFSYTVSIEAVYKKEIQYIEDLVDLSNEVNSGDSKEGQFILLTRDLDFNEDDSYREPTNTTTYGDYNGNGSIESIKTELTTGRGFYPIGDTSTHFFKANFDGQNHKLNNIYIKNAKDMSTGIFGEIANSKISNLEINGEIMTLVAVNIGGFAGNTRGKSSIVNCVSNVKLSSNASSNSIGGLVGGNLGTLTIDKSKNLNSVNNSNNTGGLVGWNRGILTINNSSNSGAITNAKGSHAGGLLGRDEGASYTTKIYNSSNTGNIILTTSNTISKYAGGLVGLGSGTLSIINSYNNGNVTGGNRTGGIIGAKGATNKIVLINKAFNNGTISSNIIVDGEITSIGGIVGYSLINGKSIILNSYNTGSVLTEDNNSNVMSTGGIIGRTASRCYSINSYNIGNISGINSFIGGINGSIYTSNLYLNNVYNAGNTEYGLFYREDGEPVISNSYYLEGIEGSNVSGQTGTSLTAEYMASPEFVNLLNQNKRNIDLSTIYDGALSDYATYELSDWKYDSTKGYPVLDN